MRLRPRTTKIGRSPEQSSGCRGLFRTTREWRRKLSKVAFLGLGVMGFPIAGHLKSRGGHDVVVYNRTAATAAKWVDKFGGASAPTPRAAASGCDIVFACVGNDSDLRAVTLGEEGAFAGMRPGAVFVDHTTASANVARELDQRGQAAEIRLRRCAGFGRPGGSRKRSAHGDVRRRKRRLCACRAGNLGIRSLLLPDGTLGRRATHENGQSNMHRRIGSGALRRTSFRRRPPDLISSWWST